MNLDSQLLHLLRARPSGVTVGEMEAALRQQGTTPNPGAVECFLRLSEKFACKSDRWLVKTDPKADAVVAALERHVQATGRHLFKADTALAGLPVDLKPTADELVAILRETMSFEVLKNGMIQYKS